MNRRDLHIQRKFCYNIHVPLKRDALLFDIGGAAGIMLWIRCLLFRLRSAAKSQGQNPARKGGGLRRRIRRPQHLRNSVLGFVAKPLTCLNEKTGYGDASHVPHAAYPYSRLSFRFLAAPATRRNFKDAPLYFSAPKRRHLAT